MTVDYCLYREIQKSQRYGDDIASEPGKMRKTVAIQTKNQPLNGREFISVINVITKLMQGRDS